MPSATATRSGLEGRGELLGPGGAGECGAWACVANAGAGDGSGGNSGDDSDADSVSSCQVALMSFVSQHTLESDVLRLVQRLSRAARAELRANLAQGAGRGGGADVPGVGSQDSMPLAKFLSVLLPLESSADSSQGGLDVMPALVHEAGCSGGSSARAGVSSQNGLDAMLASVKVDSGIEAGGSGAASVLSDACSQESLRAVPAHDWAGRELADVSSQGRTNGLPERADAGSGGSSSALSDASSQDGLYGMPALLPPSSAGSCASFDVDDPAEAGSQGGLGAMPVCVDEISGSAVPSSAASNVSSQGSLDSMPLLLHGNGRACSSEPSDPSTPGSSDGTYAVPTSPRRRSGSSDGEASDTSDSWHPSCAITDALSEGGSNVEDEGAAEGSALRLTPLALDWAPLAEVELVRVLPAGQPMAWSSLLQASAGTAANGSDAGSAAAGSGDPSLVQACGSGAGVGAASGGGGEPCTSSQQPAAAPAALQAGGAATPPPAEGPRDLRDDPGDAGDSPLHPVREAISWARSAAIRAAGVAAQPLVRHVSPSLQDKLGPGRYC